MKRFVFHFLFVFGAAILLLQLGGCSTPIKLRADESLQTVNPINSIAIVGAARVIRPRMGSKEAVLSLADSQKAVELGVHGLTKAFKEKGYRIVYAQPVGVGYKWPPNKENWVYTFGKDKDGNEIQGQKYQIMDGRPAYEYPSTENNPQYRTAVRQEFEKMYALDSERQLRNYTPSKADLATIQQVTGGDTICFMNVWGRQYSAGRKAGAVALQVVAALFGVISSGGPSDAMTTHVICSQVATGKVLWQYWYGTLNDPVEPSAGYYQKLLALFPKPATRLAHGCKFVDKVTSLYDCNM